MSGHLYSKVSSAVKKIDLFGKPIDLNYKQQDKFQTTFGGFITIVVAIILCLFFSQSISRFIQKEQITVSYEQIYDQDPPSLTLDLNKFMFAVQVTQDNFVQNPLYEVYLENRYYHRLDNGTQVRNNTQLLMEPCTLAHWSGLSQDFDWNSTYAQLGFSDWLCPRKNQTITLGGVFSSTDFNFIKISINKCNPAKVQSEYTNTSVCATEAQIANILNQRGGTAVFSIYFSNQIINPQKATPTSSYLSDETFFNFQPTKLYSNANIFFQKVEIRTDQSLMPTQDIELNEFANYQPKDFRETFEAGSPDQYAVYYFRRSSITNQYSRKYQKIDDLISYIGGFFQTVVVVLGFIVVYYNEWIFIIDIANRLYNFKQKDTALTVLKREQEMKNLLEEQQNRQQVIGRVGQNKPGSQKDTLSKRSSSSHLRDSQKKTSLRAEDIRNIIKTRSKTIKMSVTNGLQALRNRLLHVNQPPELEEGNSKLSQNTDLANAYKYEGGSDIKKVQLPIIHEQDNDIGSQHLFQHKNELQQLKPSNFNGGKQEQSPHGSNQGDQTGEVTLMQYEQTNRGFISRRQSQLMHNEDGSYTNKIQTDKDSCLNLMNKKNNNNNGNDAEFSKDLSPRYNINHNGGEELSFNQKVHTPKKNNENNNSHIEKLAAQQNGQGSPCSASKETDKVESEKLVEGLQIKSRKEFLIQQFEEVLLKQKGIVLGSKFFFNKLFFGMLFQSDENDLIQKAAELVSRDLDIYEILSKLQEVEKLKRVIFDQQQLILFNFFPKPLIGDVHQEELMNRESLTKKYKQKKKMSSSNLNQQIQSQNEDNSANPKAVGNALRAIARMKRGIIKRRTSYSDIRAYKKLYEAYEFLVDEKNQTHMNKRLVKLLGQEMEDIFKTSKLIQFQEDDDEAANLYKDQRRKALREASAKKTFLRGKTFQEVVIDKKNKDEFDEEEDEEEEEDEDINLEIGNNIQNDIEENNKNKNNYSNNDGISDNTQVVSKAISNNRNQLQNIYTNKNQNLQQHNSKRKENDISDSFQIEIPSEDLDKEKNKSSVKFQKNIIFEQNLLSKTSNRSLSLSELSKSHKQ